MGSAEARTYDRTECVSFRKTDGTFGGLSNMAPGFPLKVNGVVMRTSEALYQACRFPHLPKVQRMIIEEGSPMTAKMKSKPYRSQSRPDWDLVRVKIMRWCLRVKLAQHWEMFSRLLLSTGDRPIVEDSRKDDFWGAKPQDDGKLVGGNVLGRLLMELREQLRDPASSALKRVEPPSIPTFLLYDQMIGIVDADLGAPNSSAPTSTPRALRDLFSDREVGAPAASSSSAHTAPVALPSTPTSRAASDEVQQSDARSTLSAYPRRLIEVDLPIREVSVIARREKLNAHGSLSTLHIWWARRPPAACRAVLAAALLPDPCDPGCPKDFLVDAARILGALVKDAQSRRDVAELLGPRWQHWKQVESGLDKANKRVLQRALFEFIVLFSDPKAAQSPLILDCARKLVAAAHPQGVVTWDPFAGGGTIPVEALRLGSDAIACDLNPIAVMLNRIALEYMPKYGATLASAFSQAALRVGNELKTQLKQFYPLRDKATPIVYLWARQIRCEGPGCGALVPLIRNLQVTRDGQRWYYDVETTKAEIAIKLRKGGQPRHKPTVAGGSTTCPCCNYTTKASAVRTQLKNQHGGARDSRLLAIYMDGPGGRAFVEPTAEDREAAERAETHLDRAALPVDLINSIRPYKNTRGLSAVTRVGIERFSDLYTPRQALVLQRLREVIRSIDEPSWSPELRRAVQTLLLCAMSRLVFQNCSLSRWHAGYSKVEGAFGKQALQVVWDFAESNPTTEGPANWHGAVEWIDKVLAALRVLPKPGTVLRNAAQDIVLPDDSVDVLFTDPPYFAAIPYSDLSNVFFVWERDLLREIQPDLYSTGLVQQEREIIVTDANSGPDGTKKNQDFFHQEMTKALTAARAAVKPNGIGIVVFADSTTDAWEAILGAIIDSGWKITGSWAIDTELQNRTQAAGSASLQSSIHIVCRPRETDAGALSENTGEWKEVLGSLRQRLHEWLPRLAAENVVGADALFACLGPALECFSQYALVEKVSGDRVGLKEYLEHVWAAVSREALAMIFDDADTSGLEADARLTAMWLWTLSSGQKDDTPASTDNGDADADDGPEDEGEASSGKAVGFALEFDAARKIAQGLGARLEELGHVVEVKGGKARLLSVAERTKVLFGHAEEVPTAKRAAKKKQMTLFAGLDEAAEAQGWGDVGAPKAGTTNLDRVHQAMLLFASGRGDAMKRFLVEEGVGSQSSFWKLTQSLSALYPKGSEEKRWVDGVLARKKGLGFG